ncbi:MAG TPA: hypothetical protein VFI11_00155 [Anaerolineales bacterium]|nr:hypothetical protein [Anaerolineales bacterium]
MASSVRTGVEDRIERPTGLKNRREADKAEARAEAIAAAQDRVDKARSRLIDAAVAFCDGGISTGQLKAVRELLREQEARLAALTREATAPFVTEAARTRQPSAEPPSTAPLKPKTDAPPTGPLKQAAEGETLFTSDALVPELAQMLSTLDQKQQRLEEDFQSGRINAAQYRAIKKHYLDQREVALRLQQAHPESDRWRVVLEEGKTSFLLQLNEAVCRSFSLYDLEDRARMFAEGSVPKSAEESMAVLRNFGPGPKGAQPGRMLATQGDDGCALLLIPGRFTAALVVFSQDPPAWQVRAMRELHTNFEAANQAALSRGERRKLVFPDVRRYIRN